jgi:hypothetical protein
MYKMKFISVIAAALCQSAETAIKEAVKAGKFGHYVFKVSRVDVSAGDAKTIAVCSYTID